MSRGYQGYYEYTFVQAFGVLYVFSCPPRHTHTVNGPKPPVHV